MPRWAEWRGRAVRPKVDALTRAGYWGVPFIVVSATFYSFAAFVMISVATSVLIGGPLAYRSAQRRALLRDISGDPDELAVMLDYRLSDGTLLGVDEGMLCLVEGWLHFRGRRTEWAVGVSDVRFDQSTIHYLGETGWRVIEITTKGLSSRLALRELLGDWRSEKVGEGVAILPPSRSAPETPACTPVHVAGLVAVIGMALTVLAWLSSVTFGMWIGGLLLGALVIAMAVEFRVWSSLKRANALPERYSAIGVGD